MIRIRAALFTLSAIAAAVGMTGCERGIAVPPLPPPPSMKAVPPAYTILRDEISGVVHRFVVLTPDAPATSDDDLRAIVEHIHASRSKRTSTTVLFTTRREPYPPSHLSWQLESFASFASAARIAGGITVHIDRGVG